MSLNVYLIQKTGGHRGSGIFIRDNGQIVEITRDEWDAMHPGQEPYIAKQDDNDVVYWANITHNLNRMADAADLYDWLWAPESFNVHYAKDIIGPLEQGLAFLQSDPEHFKKFNPANGWGTYEGLVEFVEGYLAACREYPEAVISVLK